MTAVARIALVRAPVRTAAEVSEPRKLRDDAPRREFGEELAQERKPKAAAVPTAEQLALAGVLPFVPPAIEIPQIDNAAIAVGQLEQIAAPKLALVSPLDVPADSTDDEPAATPLEQAVIDLLDRRNTSPELVVTKSDLTRDVLATRIAHTAPVVEPREIKTPDAPTSHVNLVLDDGEQRVVVTVAVRGNDVNVQLRGGDDIAAGLARNAASLDEAMRLRGLSLAEFTASRDPDTQEHERPHQRRSEMTREQFTLEEVP